MTAPKYPFVPKSNTYLKPGQFWAIPLSDGRFAAGRVMAARIGAKDRTGFVAAIMDWVGDTPPTAGDLAGRSLASPQGETGFKSISHNGGVLGERPLELDGLVPIDPMASGVGTVSLVFGDRYVCKLAEQLFVSPVSEPPCKPPN